MTSHWLVVRDQKFAALCGSSEDDKHGQTPGTNFVDQLDRIKCDECRRKIENHMRKLEAPERS